MKEKTKGAIAGVVLLLAVAIFGAAVGNWIAGIVGQWILSLALVAYMAYQIKHYPPPGWREKTPMD